MKPVDLNDPHRYLNSIGKRPGARKRGPTFLLKWTESDDGQLMVSSDRRWLIQRESDGTWSLNEVLVGLNYGDPPTLRPHAMDFTGPRGAQLLAQDRADKWRKIMDAMLGKTP